ncbi:MAG TPA: ketoacyl-ACP synthase III [Peptococcaceae bacterium]|nr:ketoacyl-ACP synthase III [Peptococcaceae bacterium]
MYNVEITGTGRYLPDFRVSNDDIAQFVDTSDVWISERTGIKERRISIRENTTDMAVEAARRALQDAELRAEELDLIVVATVTPDNFFPSTACLVQARLGATRAVAFDISAACTGFIFALSIAGQFIKTGQYQKALIIGSEVLSKIVDWQDRNTCVLFADGAGAAVLERGKQGIISELLGSDGTGAEKLACSAVPLQNKFTGTCSDAENGSGSKFIRRDYITMNGREIFKFAVNIMPECILQVLENTGYSLKDVKQIVPHQANIRILEAAAKKLAINKDKFYVNLGHYGNTSGASIPIALDEMAEKGLINPGDLLIIVGFGAGLTYGAQLLRWTKESSRK